MIELFVKAASGSFVMLDLYDYDPIKMTMNVEALEDITKVAGNYSKTFRVPSTTNNDKFFRGAFNVNNNTFDASVLIESYIESDGQFFSNGNIYLQSIYSNEYDGLIEYEIYFMGEINDFSTLLGESKLSDLDFSDIEMEFTMENIVNSWNAEAGTTAGICSGNVVFPLIEWGYSYGKFDPNGVATTADVPSQTQLGYDASGLSYSFTNVNYPLLPGYFKPSVRIKYIWDKIFESVGYTYSSTFLDSTTFESLYMISDNEPRVESERNDASLFFNEGPIWNEAGTYNRTWSDVKSVYDPGQNIDVYLYKAPIAGTYSFSAIFDMDLNFAVGTVAVTTDIMSYVVPVIPAAIATDTVYYYGPVAGPIHLELLSGDVWLEKNQFVYVQNSVYISETIGFAQVLENAEFKCITTPVASSTVSSFIPTDITQIDFIKSVITKFKMVFEPDKENLKYFIIEPWKDWITQGTTRDWTDLIDGSKDLKVSPLFLDMNRKINFRDNTDTDYINEWFVSLYKKNFGELTVDSTIKIIEGEIDITTIFAPAPLEEIWNTSSSAAVNNFVIPHICTSSVDPATTTSPDGAWLGRDSYTPAPRMMFWNGLVNIFPMFYHLKGPDDLYPTTMFTYPLMSNFETFPPLSDTLDLNWKNQTPWWSKYCTLNGTTTKTAYTEYWQKWFESTYDPYARVAEANILLSPAEIQSFRFNDIIYIKDAAWQVTKITDFPLDGSGPSKVTLVKRENIGQ